MAASDLALMQIEKISKFQIEREIDAEVRSYAELENDDE